MTIEKMLYHRQTAQISDDPEEFLVIGWTVVLLGLAIFIFWAAFAPPIAVCCFFFCNRKRSNIGE